MRKALIGMVCAFVAAGTLANAQVTTVFSEDFESATDLNSLLVANGGKWEALSGTAFGSISTVQARGTKSFYSPYTDNGTGYVQAQLRTGNPSNPGGLQGSPTVPITLNYWLYDAQGAASSARRGINIAAYSSGTYGTGTLRQLVAFGVYSTTTNGKYNHRCVSGFTGAAWVAGTGPNRTVGWHELTMQIFNNNIVTLVDGAANGGNTFTAVPRNASPDNGFNTMRILNFAGTPAGDTAYATANFYFDDITVSADISVPVSVSGIWID